MAPGYDVHDARSLKIMLVNDDRPSLDMMRDMFHYKESVELVYRATSMPEAVRVAERRRPDIAVVDTKFKDRLLGPEIAEGIVKASPRTYIVAVSADPECSDRWDSKAHVFCSLPPFETGRILSAYFEWSRNGMKAPGQKA